MAQGNKKYPLVLPSPWGALGRVRGLGRRGSTTQLRGAAPAAASVATRLYFHDAAQTVSGTLPGLASRSAVAPTYNTNAGANRRMDATPGVAQVAVASHRLDPASTGVDQNDLVRRFVSDPLSGAQTVGGPGSPSYSAGIAAAIDAYNASTNAAGGYVGGLVVYVWRPSTNSLVGVVYDQPTIVFGAGLKTTGEEYRTGSAVSSTQVAAADGDVVVVEVWVDGVADTFNLQPGPVVTVYYDGTTVGSTASDAAWVDIPAPATLVFQAPSAVVADSLTTTQTEAGSAVERVAETDATSQAAAHTAAEAVSDALTTTQAATQTGAEALAETDAGAAAAVHGTAEQVAETVAQAAAAVQAAGEALRETVATTQAEAGSLTDLIAIADQLSTVQTAAQTLADALRDALTTVQADASSVGAERLAEAATTAQAAVQTLADTPALIDALATAQTSAQTAADAAAETGATAAAALHGSADAIAELAATAAVGAQALADALADAPATAALSTQTTTERVAEAASTTSTEAGSLTDAAPATAESLATAASGAQTAAEALADPLGPTGASGSHTGADAAADAALHAATEAGSLTDSIGAAGTVADALGHVAADASSIADAILTPPPPVGPPEGGPARVYGRPLYARGPYVTERAETVATALHSIVERVVAARRPPEPPPAPARPRAPRAPAPRPAEPRVPALALAEDREFAEALAILDL